MNNELPEYFFISEDEDSNSLLDGIASAADGNRAEIFKNGELLGAFLPLADLSTPGIPGKIQEAAYISDKEISIDPAHVYELLRGKVDLAVHHAGSPIALLVNAETLNDLQRTLMQYRRSIRLVWKRPAQP